MVLRGGRRGRLRRADEPITVVHQTQQVLEVLDGQRRPAQPQPFRTGLQHPGRVGKRGTGADLMALRDDGSEFAGAGMTYQ